MGGTPIAYTAAMLMRQAALALQYPNKKFDRMALSNELWQVANQLHFERKVRRPRQPKIKTKD